MPSYTMKFASITDPTSHVMIDRESRLFCCCGDESQAIGHGGTLSDDDFNRLLEGRLDVDGWTMIEPNGVKGRVYAAIVEAYETSGEGFTLAALGFVYERDRAAKPLGELVREGWVTRTLTDDCEEAIYRPAYASAEASPMKPTS